MIVLYIKMWRAAQRLREATSLEWLGGDTLRSQSTELKTPKESDEKGERNGKKVVSFKRPDNERSMSSSGQVSFILPI
jgi:hypothetical protein